MCFDCLFSVFCLFFCFVCLLFFVRACVRACVCVCVCVCVSLLMLLLCFSGGGGAGAAGGGLVCECVCVCVCVCESFISCYEKVSEYIFDVDSCRNKANGDIELEMCISECFM